MYTIERNSKYDFAGQSYGKCYPNLHKYPATMLPQIGIEVLKELNILSGKLLDPYCGSGSSFAAGLDVGLTEMYGFDMNPLAVLISQAKFTKLDITAARQRKQLLRNDIYEFIKDEKKVTGVKHPDYFHIDFWFSKPVLQHLSILHQFLSEIEAAEIRRLFNVAFSETLRECSYTRNNEFKLYRMKSEDVLKFNPDVLGVYFDRLNKVLDVYEYCYLPKLGKVQVSITYKPFPKQENYFDAVLTSPPYGDSKTTVAYGQFSQFSNEWLGIDYARQIDGLLMGGKHQKKNYTNGVLSDYIREVEQHDSKRSLEVSAFYFDLEKSIQDVAYSVKPGGKVVYVVGNRRVKGIQLPTDQFIAEKFCQNGFGHLITYERQISNKVMPSKNSPTNKTGVTLDTMTQEFIVICEKNN
jgi:hypothetical protein